MNRKVRKFSTVTIPTSVLKDILRLAYILCGTAVTITLLMLSYLSGLMGWLLVVIVIISLLLFIARSEGDI